MSLGLTTVAVIAALSLPTVLTPAQATSSSRGGSVHSTLRQGCRLTAGESLRSAQYTLTMQADGDLVLRGNGRVLWRSGTVRRAAGGTATVRGDGAFAVRDRAGHSVWATRPAGAGAALAVQTDGDLVLRTTRSVVWRTHRPGAQTLTPGASLQGGQFIQARINHARLTMQADGRLVQTGSRGGVVWSRTCAPDSVLRVQADGAIRVTAPGGSTCWSVAPLPGALRASLTMSDVNTLVQRAGASSRVVTPSSSLAGYRERDLPGAVLDQVNADRVSRGVSALRWNPRLAASAHRHNLAMASSGMLSHRLAGEPDLGPRITAAGYPWRRAGENIGLNADTSAAGALDLHRMMMAEVAPNDGHRRNILSRDYAELGVDVHRSGGQLWLTQDFGRR